MFKVTPMQSVPAHPGEGLGLATPGDVSTIVPVWCLKHPLAEILTVNPAGEVAALGAHQQPRYAIAVVFHSMSPKTAAPRRCCDRHSLDWRWLRPFS
jgi:hypothetical protein